MDVNYSVKDKNNLLTYNQWSATEYLHNFTGFAQTSTSTSSSDYSIIGNNSIHLTHENNQWWVDIFLTDIVAPGSQYNISAEVYIESGQACMRFINNQDSTLDVYNNNSGLTNLSLSCTVPEELNDPRLRFLIYNDGGGMFIDNIKVITQ